MIDTTRRVVVIGGGIAGLAAAATLRRLGGDALEVLLLEGSGRLGGKLRTGALAGERVETGAETFLTTQDGEPSLVLRLAREAGLRVRHPEPVPAAIVADGALRPIPPGTLLGVPADPSTLEGYRVALTDDDAGAPLLGPGEDIAVGTLVSRRFGTDVVRGLLDPMLGGVYAGQAERLSLAATMPGLHQAAQRQPTLRAAVRDAIAAARRTPGQPVFATVEGGLSTLVDELATGVTVRLGATARELAHTSAGWEIAIGQGAQSVLADAVVLAVPAKPAARLLARECPEAGAQLGELDYASVALVTLALPPGTALPELSGFLVPASEGFAVKAATFFARKWGHDPRRPVLVRASLGRSGDVGPLQHPDGVLVETVRHELATILDARLPVPVAASVTRWGGALPQYPVGHVARVARARAALPTTIAVAGAAVDGVGIAACVTSGAAAAQRIWSGLTQSDLA